MPKGTSGTYKGARRRRIDRMIEGNYQASKNAYGETAGQRFRSIPGSMSEKFPESKKHKAVKAIERAVDYTVKGVKRAVGVTPKQAVARTNKRDRADSKYKSGEFDTYMAGDPKDGKRRKKK